MLINIIFQLKSNYRNYTVTYIGTADRVFKWNQWSTCSVVFAIYLIAKKPEKYLVCWSFLHVTRIQSIQSIQSCLHNYYVMRVDNILASSNWAVPCALDVSFKHSKNHAKNSLTEPTSSWLPIMISWYNI